MIAFCKKCGGAIVRGDSDFIRDIARGGFSHRNCELHERPKSAKIVVEEVMQAIRERQHRPLSELAKTKSRARTNPIAGVGGNPGGRGTQ